MDATIEVLPLTSFLCILLEGKLKEVYSILEDCPITATPPAFIVHIATLLAELSPSVTGCEYFSVSFLCESVSSTALVETVGATSLRGYLCLKYSMSGRVVMTIKAQLPMTICLTVIKISKSSSLSSSSTGLSEK